LFGYLVVDFFFLVFSRFIDIIAREKTNRRIMINKGILTLFQKELLSGRECV